jgi:probable phosphoglycerate mutase
MLMTQPRPRFAVTATVLHLVRHGQSTWNANGLVQGQSPQAGSLTTRGRREAATAARQLDVQADGIDAVVSSDLDRAAATAAIIGGHLGVPVEVDQGLREQRLGQLEGCGLAGRLGGAGVAEMVAALWHDPDRRPPGGESVSEMYSRVCAALDRIATAHPGGQIVVVTHGGPIRCVAAAVSQQGVAAIRHSPVANASITTVSIRPSHTLCAAGAAA